MWLYQELAYSHLFNSDEKKTFPGLFINDSDGQVGAVITMFIKSCKLSTIYMHHYVVSM